MKFHNLNPNFAKFSNIIIGKIDVEMAKIINSLKVQNISLFEPVISETFLDHNEP